MRFVAVLLALTLATTGCATPSQTRTAGLIAGGVLVAGGVGMLVAMDPGDDDHTLSEGGTAACVLGGCVLAGSAIVAGLAVAALSVILTDETRRLAPLPSPQAPSSRRRLRPRRSKSISSPSALSPIDKPSSRPSSSRARLAPPRRAATAASPW
jgi:hypothetical protein